MDEGMMPLEPRLCLSTVLWDGGGDGTNWTDPLNWDTDAVPDGSSEVVIDVAGDPTITLPANRTAVAKSITSRERMLFLNLTTLDVAEPSVFEADVQSTGYLRFRGAGTLSFSAVFSAVSPEFDTGGAVDVGPAGELHLSGYTTIRRDIAASGLTRWTSLLTLFEGGSFSNSGELVIDTTQSIEIRTRNAGASFKNTGTLTKLGFGELFCTDTTQYPLIVTNSGTVDVQAGRLSLGDEGAHTGSFTTSLGGELVFTGDHTFDPAISITGAGAVEFHGTASVEFTIDIGELRVSYGTVEMHTPFAAARGVTLNGGALSMHIPWSFDNIRIAGGGVTGPADVEFVGVLDWTGGGIGGTGARRFAPGSTVNISGPDDKGFSAQVVNETLITWTGGSLTSSYLGGGLTNLGQIEVSITVGQCTLPSLLNLGTIHISRGTIHSSRAVVNQGEIIIQQGLLVIQNGGEMAGAIELLGTAAGVTFRGADFQLHDGSTIHGVGTATFNGEQSRLEVYTEVDVGKVIFLGFNTFYGPVSATNGLSVNDGATAFRGTLSLGDNLPINGRGEIDLGTNDLRVSSGRIGNLTTQGLLEISGEVEWPSGMISGEGLLRVLPGGTLAGTENYRHIFDLDIEVLGTMRWPVNTSEFNGATVENFGVIIADIPNFANTEGPGAVINHGVLRKLGSAGLSLGRISEDFTFSNDGYVIVEEDSFAAAHPVDLLTDPGVLLRGTWEVLSGAELHLGADAPIRVLDEGAIVRLRGLGGEVAGLDGLSSLRGELELLDGARLIASPSARWLTQSGRLRVGIGSWISVQGTLAQTGTAVTQVEVAGVSTQELGRVRASETVWLSGTLELIEADGYIPAEGSQHEIVTGTLVGGEFVGVALPDAQPTDKWALRFDTGGLTALHTDIADMNLDGQVNTIDAVYFLSLWAAGDQTADLNGDGVIDTQDVLFWLGAWSDG